MSRVEELPDECHFKESHPEYCIYVNRHETSVCCEHCGIPCKSERE